MSPHHLIIGGQRSGKSRHAERLAQAWLQRSPEHSVTVVATAMASDDEMRARIVRHQQDRPSAFGLLEAPLDLGKALRTLADPQRMVVIDCLTLWVTNVLMPVATTAGHASGSGDDGMAGAAMGDAGGAKAGDAFGDELASPWMRPDWSQRKDALLQALRERAGPVALVSNEIGMGVVPLGADVRQVVDELGRLHQDVAQLCGHITVMVAGQPFTQEVQRWS